MTPDDIRKLAEIYDGIAVAYGRDNHPIGMKSADYTVAVLRACAAVVEASQRYEKTRYDYAPVIVALAKLEELKP